ncbi:hypothetical protein H4R21_002952 [Coemansia helicoidea]|uniref:Uncharacterized protein n=1 Tax=Coemansia helicoidea TaxID=1286919 RepID=A0ACC1L4X4_9FUNG|nr:hypothetical protein H4R21_002952 [Coemansia helicoidea]
MAETHSDESQWWCEDGPADYEGPQSTAQVPGEGLASNVDAYEVSAEDGVAADTEHESEAPEAAADRPDQSQAQPARHFKGAARQRKAESKKRRKEMAKMKKRQAAIAGDDAATAVGGSDDKAGGMSVIFI